MVVQVLLPFLFDEVFMIHGDFYLVPIYSLNGYFSEMKRGGQMYLKVGYLG